MKPRPSLGPRTQTITESWQDLLDDIGAGCHTLGSWSGEARRFREVMDATRLGPRIAERIVARLAEAGYEGSLRFESDMVIVTPTGTKELAATVQALLPGLRALDAQIPKLPWKDELVASRAVGRWLANRADRSDGVNR